MKYLHMILRFGTFEERVTGMQFCDFINWIFLFSFVGYLIECVDVSLENKKLVTNRGFVHGPFCIIYGLCAFAASLILRPFMSSNVALFIASAVFATTAEFVTAQIMIRLFGGFWWDYSKRPFNYKGIISLGSTLGWGVLGVAFFRVLNHIFVFIVTHIPRMIALPLSYLLVLYYIIDFCYCLNMAFKDDEATEKTVGRLKVRND